MRLKIIACNVFTREICHCIARSPHVTDVEFTELGEHVNSAGLRQTIQERVDAAERSGKGYSAIALAFGLCGNSIVGLTARQTPLVIPRAHDCCTILLGSKHKFQEHFADNPSMPFSSNGYLDRGEYYLRVEEEGQTSLHFGDAYLALVEQYGEENAKYVWEAMHPPGLHGNRAVFIENPETAPLGHAARFREKAEADGKEFVLLQGSLAILQKLAFGEWDAETFLTVHPGETVKGVYDWSEVIRAGRDPAA